MTFFNNTRAQTAFYLGIAGIGVGILMAATLGVRLLENAHKVCEGFPGSCPFITQSYILIAVPFVAGALVMLLGISERKHPEPYQQNEREREWN